MKAELNTRIAVDGLQRASELNKTRTHLDSVINDSKESEIAQVQKLTHQLDRKRKTLEGTCL